MRLAVVITMIIQMFLTLIGIAGVSIMAYQGKTSLVLLWGIVVIMNPIFLYINLKTLENMKVQTNA